MDPGSPTPRSPRAAEEGSTLRIGPYEVIEELARGGMGVVYRARDPDADREVALKLLSRADERLRLRFAREAEALGKLRHPGIVPVHAAGESEGTPYLVMELVAGTTLARRLEAGPMPVKLAGALVRDLARAVAYAHERGVIHRDIKPDNVLLDERGRPRLTDFGLAWIETSVRLSMTGQAMGTPGYWAPELARGELESVGAPADIYGLGGTLYAALTGEPPHRGENYTELFVATLERLPDPPSALRPDGDDLLDEVCLRCLAKSPGERFGDAAELASELEQAIGVGSSSYRPLVLGVLSVILLAALVAGGLALRSWTRGEQAEDPLASPSVEPVPLSWAPRADQESTHTLKVELEMSGVGKSRGLSQNPLLSGRELNFAMTLELDVRALVVAVDDKEVELSLEVEAVRSSYLSLLGQMLTDTGQPPAPLPSTFPLLVGRMSRRYVLDHLDRSVIGASVRVRADARTGALLDLGTGDLFQRLSAAEEEHIDKLRAHLYAEPKLARRIAKGHVRGTLGWANAHGWFFRRRLHYLVERWLHAFPPELLDEAWDVGPSSPVFLRELMNRAMPKIWKTDFGYDLGVLDRMPVLGVPRRARRVSATEVSWAGDVEGHQLTCTSTLAQGWVRSFESQEEAMGLVYDVDGDTLTFDVKLSARGGPRKATPKQE